MKKRVVITGMDLATSIGSDLTAFWHNLIGGNSGIDRIKAYDASDYPTQIAGEITDLDFNQFPHLNKPKRYSRATRIGLICAKKAIAASGLSVEQCADGGTFIGTGLGGNPESEAAYSVFFDNQWKKIPALTITRGMPNAIANAIALECGLKSANRTFSNACNSSAESIGHGFEQIQWGKLPFAVCGGSEAMIWESLMAAWCKLRVMSKSNEQPAAACRPFSADRDGMVMAEGAAMLVLEEYEHATRRGANIIAEIIGFGSSCDAFHITAPNSEGQARAIRAALADAKVSASDVHYINAHGTATALNDTTETQSIKQVFGEHAYAMPVSAIKSMIGHAIGAAGAIQVIATALSLQTGLLPPTINLHTPDSECDLDYVPLIAREKPISIALSNHFAFGGTNSALLLAKV